MSGEETLFWQYLRTRRDNLLSRCDWTQLPDVPANSKSSAWLAYRAALRNLPATVTWTSGMNIMQVTWPTNPNGENS